MADPFKEKEKSLEETATWAVAVVCFVLIVISLFIERLIDKIGTVSRSCSCSCSFYHVSCSCSASYSVFITSSSSPALFRQFRSSSRMTKSALCFFYGSGLNRSTRGVCMKLLKKLKQVNYF